MRVSPQARASVYNPALIRPPGARPEREFLKRCIAYLLYWSGALWIYRRVLLRNRAIVLTYHRVLPDSADSCSAPGIVVTPSVFEANMKFL